MAENLIKSQSLIIIYHEYLLNEVFKLTADLLPFWERVLTSFYSLKSKTNSLRLERAELEFQAIQYNSHSPNIGGKGIAEPADSLRRNVVRSTASLSLQLAGVRKLTSKAEIS